MMKTEWKRAQGRLGVAQDGDDGPATWGALVGFVARRPGAAVCLLRGRALARSPVMFSPERIADFLANVSHETSDFTKLREAMSYSTAERIRKTWPSRFPTLASAQPFVRNPVALANKVYDRPKEGNTRPGDGWRFRGGGDIQTTFANGYRRASADVGIDLYAEPDRIAEPGVGILTALGYYFRNRLWDYVDTGRTTACRAVLNTGNENTPRARIIGIDDVDARRRRILDLFK